MKKSLFILVMLLCMALFALPALATETECTHEFTRCTGLCEDCDATGLPTENAYHAWGEFTRTETQCWTYCDDCGIQLGLTEHFTYCGGSDLSCLSCGTTEGTIVIRHHSLSAYEYDDYSHWRTCSYCNETETGNHSHTGVYQHDDSYCWEICPDCGIELSKFPHEAACNNPGVCQRCGIDWDVEAQHAPLVDTLTYDENYCWYLCAYCGEEVEKSAHFIICSTPGVCNRCGAAASDSASVIHAYDYETRKYDAEYCWNECTGCGEKTQKWEHSVSCANPGVCTECGATGCTNDVMHNVDEGNVTTDATHHWQACLDCDEKLGYEAHWVSCDGEPGLCSACSAAYDGQPTHWIGANQAYVSDGTYHWYVCSACGEEVNKEEHRVACDSNGICYVCGEACGEDIEVAHYRYADTPYEYDETHHWFICVMCNEPAMKGEHKFRESERDESKVVYTCGCGATKEEQLHVEHVWIESARVEATCGVKGEIVCICECGETKTEEIPALEHSYTTTETPATCGVDGKKVTTCVLCGDTTTEVILALEHEYVITSMRQPTCTAKGVKEVTCEHCDDEIVTYIDVVAHSYAVTSETAATCEQDGAIVSTCANCGAEQTEAIPATGHAYGVYAPAGDGTHVAECNTCGATRVRNCEYQDVETNGITLTVCSVCGHTRYAELPAEGTVEPDTLFVPTKVAAATAVTTAGEELQSGVQLVIYDQTAMLQEGSPILAMYTLGLESDGYAVKPQSALRVELPLTEEQTAETFAQYKLVIIALDGTMTEIEYKIEEGKIIFETELVGILAFLPIEE